MNPRQVRRLPLSPERVAGLVLWSKNPQPLLSALDEINRYSYYIQFTLNAYGREVEPGLPPLQERIDTLLRWADAVGPERVIWRYDPILLSSAYPAVFHLERVSALAEALRGATRLLTISFLDDYIKTRRRVAALGAHCPSKEEITALTPPLAAIAYTHGLRIAACAEQTDLSAWGVEKARCVDPKLIADIKGSDLPVTQTDPNQRPYCGCAASVDIGAYNCCAHHCVYCYANAGTAAVKSNLERHDPMGESLLMI